jgi:undecaprenyl pyrophosphate synthase
MKHRLMLILRLPDFNEDKFMEAVVDFSERQRRFGKISEQVS